LTADGKQSPVLGTEFIGGSPPPGGPRPDSSLLETARRQPYLVVVAGARRGAEFTLGTGAVTIGRGEDADVQIDEPAASRRHAVIEARRGVFVLRDLGSTNGTYLRGLLHGSEAALRDGDHFRIGETELVFRAGGSVP
jgi:pSer/pThr/pTyr-binding forkhead associated (FHA) protein